MITRIEVDGFSEPRTWASPASESTLPVQILLTTHSPVALAALRAHPQHLRFIDMVRRNGERVTRVRCVGKPAAGDHGRSMVSPREVDALLQAVESEESA